MPFTTLTDQQEKELWRLSRVYWQGALRCEKAKAYLAGCVTLGSALETLLILRIGPRQGGVRPSQLGFGLRTP